MASVPRFVPHPCPVGLLGSRARSTALCSTRSTAARMSSASHAVPSSAATRAPRRSAPAARMRTTRRSPPYRWHSARNRVVRRPKAVPFRPRVLAADGHRLQRFVPHHLRGSVRSQPYRPQAWRMSASRSRVDCSRARRHLCPSARSGQGGTRRFCCVITRARIPPRLPACVGCLPAHGGRPADGVVRTAQHGAFPALRVDADLEVHVPPVEHPEAEPTR